MSGSFGVYKKLLCDQLAGVCEISLTGTGGLYVGARIRFGETSPVYEVVSIGNADTIKVRPV